MLSPESLAVAIELTTLIAEFEKQANVCELALYPDTFLLVQQSEVRTWRSAADRVRKHLRALAPKEET